MEGMSKDELDKFKQAIRALSIEFHGGTYQDGFALIKALRELADEWYEEIADEMSQPQE
jgi:hypothetical protein